MFGHLRLGDPDHRFVEIDATAFDSIQNIVHLARVILVGIQQIVVSRAFVKDH